MRRRTFAALGAALTVGVTGWAVVAAPVTAPRASAGELTAFADCEELRQWYVDAALPMVGPWGLGSSITALEDGGVVAGEAQQSVRGASPDDAVGNGETGTNVQEAGVDEPDVAKTNGEIVVTVDHGGGGVVGGPVGGDAMTVPEALGQLVVTDVTGAARELARLPLPAGIGGAELLLVGDTVVVIGTGYGYAEIPPNVRLAGPFPGGGSNVQVITVDISDPASPQIEDKVRYDGTLVSARQYGETVRLVTSSDLPGLDFVMPEPGVSSAEARRKNRATVANSTLADWLPSAGSLLDCTDVRHPDVKSGLGTLSVVSFDADSPRQRSATAVTAAGDLVYSSTDRLYVATSAGGWWGGPVPLVDSTFASQPMRTQVHAFGLDGTDTSYLASGTVPGWVRDRWSFSEHEGLLRVATALGDSWNPRENAVVVLEERGDDLVLVGRVDGMGIDEQIQSVRWFGDLAVLVTFRQVDPLYTVDLSEPTDPEVLGELKIPGFSSYLHPIGDQRLLGLGQDATLQGTSLGAQAAVFDLTDLTDPKRLDTMGFGRNTQLTSTADPRGFTYLPDEHAALSPVQDYLTGDTRLAILRVGPDGSLTTTTTERIGGRWGSGVVRTLPLRDNQVALVVDGEVSVLSV